MENRIYQRKKSLSRPKFAEEDLSVVKKILGQLTPERVKREIGAVQKVKLPPELQRWVREYEKVGEREDFIWKWFFGINQELTLLSIKEEYKKPLEEFRFLVTLLVISIDDISDKMRNEDLLSDLRCLFFTGRVINSKQLSSKDNLYVFPIVEVWEYIKDGIQKFPKYGKYRNVFGFYISQMFGSMYYDFLINKNHDLISKRGAWQYSTYSMPVIIDIILNLMCSSKFSNEELPTLMEIGWKAQKMTRIGNWISTWERELKENDFSSGVFAYALDANIIGVADLDRKNEFEIVKKIKDMKIEHILLKEWEQSYWKILELGSRTKTINIEKFLVVLEKILSFELISRGYK